MPWFKIDDGFHGHPKVVELSLSAVGIWTLAGSWCAKYLTDGLVSGNAFRRMGGEEDLAAELVGAGLWLTASDGFEFKDWADYQPLKVDVEAERAAAQERMRSVRARKKGVRANEPRTAPERSDEQTANFARSSPDVRVTPSHPSPIPAQPQEEQTSVQPPVEPASKTDAILAEFEQWWEDYPRKQGKADALKAFRAARKKATLARLVSAVAEYKLAHIGVDKSKLKMAGGWLRGERWEDELIVVASPEIPQSAFEQPRQSVQVPPRAGVGMCLRHRDYPLPCDRCAEES